MSEGKEDYDKRDHIFDLISNYPFSCDLIVSCFYAAVFSDRYETRADPFPPAYMESDNKDVNLLRKVLNDIPPLAIIRKLLRYKEDFEYIELLDWLFNVVDPKSLELTETAHLHLPIDQQPQLVFGTKSSDAAEKMWNRKKKQKNSLHAFYGTNLENLYSTLKHGLNPDFSTTTIPLYGEGIYLTNQISVSLLFSPFSEVWKYSMLGEKLRVLVLGEIIDDSSKIRRLKKDRTLDECSNSTYIIVKDKTYVRAKYFFVYTKNTPSASIFTKKNLLRVFSLVFILLLVIYFYLNKHIFLDMMGSYLLH